MANESAAVSVPGMNVVSFNHLPLVQINAPAFYDDPAFLAWLNTPGVATWHHAGSAPGGMSDVFFTFCDGDGSDAPTGGDNRPSIPAHIWDQISAVLKPNIEGGECVVWLTNLRG